MSLAVGTYKRESKKMDLNRRNDIIMEYLPLVKYVANKISTRLPSHVEIDDLINAGILGLIDAIDKFDPQRKIKFKTYAEFRIKGAILDELRSLDWVPRSTRQKVTKIERAYADLEQSLGRGANDSEVADYLKITLEEFYSLISEAKGISLISIDELRKDDDDSLERNLLDYLTNPEALSPSQLVNLDEIYKIVASAIDELPEKERLVISLYYYDELTMKEIGEIMDVTESRVSQIHTKSVIRLRARLLNVLEL